MAKTRAERFGEFVGYTIIAVALIVFLSLSFGISYWALSWALGWR